MALGQILRKLRNDNKLSLRELARRIDCSPAFVSDVELGRRYPSEQVLAAIALALKTTPAKLKAHDTRVPIEALKAKIAANQRFALAFRALIDSDVSPDELMEFVEQRGRKK